MALDGRGEERLLIFCDLPGSKVKPDGRMAAERMINEMIQDKLRDDGKRGRSDSRRGGGRGRSPSRRRSRSRSAPRGRYQSPPRGGGGGRRSPSRGGRRSPSPRGRYQSPPRGGRSPPPRERS